MHARPPASINRSRRFLYGTGDALPSPEYAPWVYWCMCRCGGTSVGVQSDAYTEADEVSANFVNRPQLTCCVGRAWCTHVYTGELDDETAG